MNEEEEKIFNTLEKLETVFREMGHDEFMAFQTIDLARKHFFQQKRDLAIKIGERIIYERTI